MRGQAKAAIVLRTEEVQPIGRKGGCRVLAAAGVQHFLHPRGRFVTLANGDEAAHDVADHVVQEGAAFKIKAPVARWHTVGRGAFAHGAVSDINPVQSFDRCFCLTCCRAEGRKVMLAQ